VDWVKAQHTAAVAELDRYLKKHPDLMADWRAVVEDTTWPDAEKDREIVLERVIGYTEKLLTDEWDMRKLQDGHHEFRRKVRRLAIVSQAMSDLFQLDDRLPTRFDKILSDPSARGEFAELPPAEKRDAPILVLRSLYYELNRALVQLGTSKDLGEAAEEWLPEALLESGVTKNRKEAVRLAEQYVKKHPEYETPSKTASRVYESLRQSNKRYTDEWNRGVFASLHFLLRTQRDWTKFDCDRAWQQLD
jgi:hypothetical protein